VTRLPVLALTLLLAVAACENVRSGAPVVTLWKVMF
jgi:hypothetical protein